jgi:hypothetical protein
VNQALALAAKLGPREWVTRVARWIAEESPDGK